MTTVVPDADIRVMEKYASQRTHTAIITSLLREDDVVTFHVIMTLLLRRLSAGLHHKACCWMELFMHAVLDDKVYLPRKSGNACGVCITSKLKENSEVVRFICKILFDLGQTHIEYMSKHELLYTCSSPFSQNRIFPRELLLKVYIIYAIETGVWVNDMGLSNWYRLRENGTNLKPCYQKNTWQLWLYSPRKRGYCELKTVKERRDYFLCVLMHGLAANYLKWCNYVC